MTFNEYKWYEGEWKDDQMEGKGLMKLGTLQREGWWYKGKRLKWLI
jgi:hypothetical protein